MRCFVCVANQLNLTRAADIMGVTQPAMSVQMRELERETGLELLDRSHGRLSLTRSGAIVRDGFADILSMYESTLMRARGASVGRAGVLKVGYHGALTAFAPLFREFGAANPDVELRVRVAEWLQLANMVVSGELDIAFIERHETDIRPELESAPFFRETYFCAAMGASHPLAHEGSVSVAQVQGERVFMNGFSSASMDSMYRQLIANGLRRETFRMTESVDDSIAMVASGGGIATMPRFLAMPGNPAVTWVPVRDTDFVCDIVVAWRRGNDNPNVAALARHCQRPEVLEELRAAWPAPMEG